MMQPIVSLIFIIPLFFLQCAEKKSIEERIISPKHLSEDGAISQLSPFLFAHPVSQTEIDQNILINYAIDQKLDVQSSRSGLFYQIIEPGEGPKLSWGDKIQVYYKGFTIPDETTVDSNWAKLKPMEFYIGNMIKGWNEGLQFVSNKSQLLLLIPSHLAYADDGFKDIIGANQCLGFYIQVENIVPE